MAAPLIVPVLGFILFVSLIIYNFVFIGRVSPNPDNQEVDEAIRMIMYINGGLIFILLFLSFYYVQVNPAVEKRYVFLMLHVNLFFALLAVSISVLTKRQ